MINVVWFKKMLFLCLDLVCVRKWFKLDKFYGNGEVSGWMVGENDNIFIILDDIFLIFFRYD